MQKLAIFLWSAAVLAAADLSVGPVSTPVAPGQTLTIPITLRTQETQLVALQFNLLWDKANLTVTSQTGAATAAAKKNANQSDLPGGAIFLLLGTNPLDLTPLADGVVVDLTVQVGEATPPGRYSLTLASASGSDDTGKSVTLQTINGSLTLEGAPRAPATLNLGTLTVSAAEQTGASYVVESDLIATDTLSLQVAGEIGLGKINDNADNQMVNAAGVFTAPDAGGCLLSDESLVPKACVGALVIGNDALGYVSLFPPSAAVGLGKDSAPLNLALRPVELATLFGPEVVLPQGTTLVVKVNAKTWEDNTGAFEVSPACIFGLPLAGLAASALPVSSQLTVAISAGCAWTGLASAPWISITNGASGDGSGVVNYTIEANNGARRHGEILFTGPEGSSPVRLLVGQGAAGSIFSPNARDLSLPDGLEIEGADSIGISVQVLADYSPNHTITATVSGEVSVGKLNPEDPEPQRVNPAGIFTAPASGRCLTAPDLPAPAACQGAVLIGNATLGFRPLFAANAASGLDSATPAVTLSLAAAPILSVFGEGVPIPAGTILYLKSNDSTSYDNSGAFRTGTPTANPN